MAYTPTNSNGQKTMANSAPVVISSDQTQVPVQLNAIQGTTTGTITTSTSTVVATDLSGIGAVTVSVYGTYAGVNFTFEIYDGVNWIAIAAQPIGSVTPAAVIATGVIANAILAWNVSPLFGVQQFRVRATAYTSGTANIRIEPSAQFGQSLINVATMPTTTVTGTVATTQSTSPWVTREAVAATPTITQVTPTTTSTTLKASNANRKAIILVNGGTSDCYVTYGATSTSTTYTFILPSLGTTTIRGEEYSGVISGIWVATGGNSMQVTEIV